MPHTRESDTPQDARDQKYRNWEAYQASENGTNPFKDLIQKDGTVCDNCFLIRYDTQTREWWRGSFGWLDYERWDPIPDRCVEVPADSPADGTRLACRNCGMRGGKDRPVPKHLIREYTVNIAATLDFKEIRYDFDTLLEEVYRLNTSKNQGRQDSHVFAPAVQTAIRREQG